jgi:hypothetical protein
MSNELELPIQELSTAITIIPPTKGALAALSKYARSGGGNFYGELLKFNGKTGEYTAGPQNTAITSGTELAALVPAIGVGHIRWKDGEVLDQTLDPLTEDYDPSEAREKLGDTDRSLWSTNEDGEPVDPWREQVALPLKSLIDGREYTFSSSSSGGVRAVKRLVGIYSRHVKALPEMPQGHALPIPLVTLGSTDYKHKIKQRGTIFNPEFQPSGWIDLRAALAMAAPLPEETKKFEDFRSGRARHRQRKKAV